MSFTAIPRDIDHLSWVGSRVFNDVGFFEEKSERDILDDMEVGLNVNFISY